MTKTHLTNVRVKFAEKISKVGLCSLLTESSKILDETIVEVVPRNYHLAVRMAHRKSAKESAEHFASLFAAK
jgi:hypothetical protein